MNSATIVRAPVAVLFVLAIAGLSACGGSGRGDEDRPPVPITIAVQIGEDEVTASPSKFGAGPVTLLVSNQTKVAQKLEIDGPKLNRMLPVDPTDTASMKATLQPGDYTLTTATSQQTPPFTLEIGSERGTAQDRLLLP